MAKHEVVTPHTLEAAHKRIAALEKDLAIAKRLGGSVTETMAWESDKADYSPCACPEAESLRSDLAEVRRHLLDTHKRADAAEEHLKDIFDLADAWRTK